MNFLQAISLTEPFASMGLLEFVSKRIKCACGQILKKDLLQAWVFPNSRRQLLPLEIGWLRQAKPGHQRRPQSVSGASAARVWWPNLKDFDGTNSSILMAQAQILWAQTQVLWWPKLEWFGKDELLKMPKMLLLEISRFTSPARPTGSQSFSTFVTHKKIWKQNLHYFKGIWKIQCQIVNLTTLAVMFDFSSQFTLKFWGWVDSILADHSKCPF